MTTPDGRTTAQALDEAREEAMRTGWPVLRIIKVGALDTAFIVGPSGRAREVPLALAHSTWMNDVRATRRRRKAAGLSTTRPRTDIYGPPTGRPTES